MKLALAFLFAASLVLAADITGTWKGSVVLDAGSGNPTFDFKQDGEKLSGTYHGQFGDAPLNGTVKGKSVEFSFTVQGLVASYNGTLDGETAVKGTADYGAAGKGTFTIAKN